MFTLFFFEGFSIFVYTANSLKIVKNEEMGAKTGSIYHILFVNMNRIKCTTANIKLLWQRSLMLTHIWFSSLSRKV